MAALNAIPDPARSKDYKKTLRRLQVELVKLQRHFTKCWAPWTIVRADDKRQARLNVIRDLLTRLHYAKKNPRLIAPEPSIICPWDAAAGNVDMLAP